MATIIKQSREGYRFPTIEYAAAPDLRSCKLAASSNIRIGEVELLKTKGPAETLEGGRVAGQYLVSGTWWLPEILIGADQHYIHINGRDPIAVKLGQQSS